MTAFDKEVRSILQKARRAGWRVHRSRRGHWVVYPADPAQPSFTCSPASTDWQAIKNLRRDFRRAGLDI